MRSFKETFEDPFEAVSNSERKERGAPDYEPSKDYDNSRKIVGQTNIDRLWDAVSSMNPLHDLIFKNIGGQILATHTSYQLGKILLEVAPLGAGTVKASFYISALRRMRQKFSYIKIAENNTDKEYEWVSANSEINVLIFKIIGEPDPI
jgi:hypothetical protein